MLGKGEIATVLAGALLGILRMLCLDILAKQDRKTGLIAVRGMLHSLTAIIDKINIDDRDKEFAEFAKFATETGETRHV